MNTFEISAHVERVSVRSINPLQSPDEAVVTRREFV
jgi:hypothetical protein